jgi:hypothetical protein
VAAHFIASYNAVHVQCRQGRQRQRQQQVQQSLSRSHGGVDNTFWGLVGWLVELDDIATSLQLLAVTVTAAACCHCHCSCPLSL